MPRMQHPAAVTAAPLTIPQVTRPQLPGAWTKLRTMGRGPGMTHLPRRSSSQNIQSQLRTAGRGRDMTASLLRRGNPEDLSTEGRGVQCITEKTTSAGSRAGAPHATGTGTGTGTGITTAAGITGATDGRRVAEAGPGRMTDETAVQREGAGTAGPLRGVIDVDMTKTVTLLNLSKAYLLANHIVNSLNISTVSPCKALCWSHRQAAAACMHQLETAV